MLILLLTFALATLAMVAAYRIYMARIVARNTRLACAFRAASILRNAAKYLEQYGTGRDFEFNNARHILLYAQDLIIKEATERR